MALRGWEGERGESSDSRREHAGIMGGKAGTLYFNQILEETEGNLLFKLHIREQELELIDLCIPEQCLR